MARGGKIRCLIMELFVKREGALEMSKVIGKKHFQSKNIVRSEESCKTCQSSEGGNNDINESN